MPLALDLDQLRSARERDLSVGEFLIEIDRRNYVLGDFEAVYEDRLKLSSLYHGTELLLTESIPYIPGVYPLSTC